MVEAESTPHHAVAEFCHLLAEVSTAKLADMISIAYARNRQLGISISADNLWEMEKRTV